ncbi:MAG: hypothetical protein QOJ74_960, partial [Ilumatobacteraceae bacterium]|nr:hypothetical protein [Ilumatobacteraceae bacterium]
KAFLLAFGLAIATNIVIEVTRHYLKSHRATAATR